MPARILVIDDTPEILELFQDLLTDEGYEVLLAARVMQHVTEVERLRPDLIILDLLFGTEAAGGHLLHALRGHVATAAIPLIVCTAATAQLHAYDADLHLPGVSVVAKPFDVDDVLRTINTALEVRGSREELATATTHPHVGVSLSTALEATGPVATTALGAPQSC
jgi:DNA-binding response OmpR family regulator